VDVWCCGKLVSKNFCVQCGQPAAAAASSTTTASPLLGEEDVVMIKKEKRVLDIIYISD